ARGAGLIFIPAPPGRGQDEGSTSGVDGLYKEAVARFEDWFGVAREQAVNEPAAVTLATADASGQPAARTVLLKHFDERGFVFYTNTRSRKGRHLGHNPRAALCFFWQALMR